MKKFLTVPMILVASSVAMAQENELTPNKTSNTTQSPRNADTQRTILMPTSKLIGATLKDKNGDDCGTVSSFVFNKQGEAMFVIVGKGGLLGIGEEEVAVPWAAFSCECKMEGDEMTCHPKVAVVGKELVTAKCLRARQYTELTDAQWVAENAKFYNVAASVVPVKDGICTSHFINATVKSSDNLDAGVLDEFMIEQRTGKVPAVVIGTGGVAGVGKSFVALPFAKVSFGMDKEKATVRANMTKSAIEGAQKVTADEYPELQLSSVINKLNTELKDR